MAANITKYEITQRVCMCVRQRSCDLAEWTGRQMDTVIDWPTHARTHCTLDTHIHICHPSFLLLLITSSRSLWALGASHSASGVIQATLLSVRLSLRCVSTWLSLGGGVLVGLLDVQGHLYIGTVCIAAALVVLYIWSVFGGYAVVFLRISGNNKNLFFLSTDMVLYLFCLL